ncbi:MAG: DEAD/DEAH box helicase [Ketobacter sp.]|nr:MAG: DEAD/DEAH box helicase [Ketobacter sp.]
MKPYFSSLVAQSISRTAEATLSILGITHPGLRDHLGQQMRSECGTPGSFLASPLFEQTFGWQQAEKTMSDLAESGLLSQKVVDSLDNPANKRYRFGANWKPFTHQLASWQALLEKQHSIVVTSGTGSGKTECFMVPVLEDLYSEYKQKGERPLVGVRALYLYPLNALINSQRERLDAWTREFGKGIRYCLYNGNTVDRAKKVTSKQKLHPNEVLSRETLRNDPTPILVTNGTMLEYMMVRQVDAPILQKSREEKSLRWIVLDEAHTYVGSQAAELALQLRRVMHAFGVEPKDVRFVATSATIAGEDVGDQLKQFLSDLSGVPTSQIDVLGGNRVVPDLEPCSEQRVRLEDLEAMAQAAGDVNLERYRALVHSPEARSIRHSLVKAGKAMALSDIRTRLSNQFNRTFQSDEVLRWLDVCTGTKPSDSEEAFLKVRAHFFQRTTQGLWACFNPGCEAKKGTPIEVNWPWGFVYVNQRQKCDCGSSVYELAFCQECNEPHLLVRDRNGQLTQWESHIVDEFSLQSEAYDDSESVEVNAVDSSGNSLNERNVPLILSTQINESNGYIPVTIDQSSGRLMMLTESPVELGLNAHDLACSQCAFKGYNQGKFYRQALLGAPFYVANAVPTVLEYCPDFQGDGEERLKFGPNSLPGRGRRLITFTDSRQGTARISVRMQQEAERSRLRGLLVDILKEAQSASVSDKEDGDPQTVEEMMTLAKQKHEAAKILETSGSANIAQGLKDEADALIKKAEALQSGSLKPEAAILAWSDVVSILKDKADVLGAMLIYNRSHKQELFGQQDGPFKLAELLLLREFRRRPKRQNSLETQGIVKVCYLGLEKVNLCPEQWEKYGLSLRDWQDFVKITLDFYVRENSYMQMDIRTSSWIGTHFSSKSLRKPDSAEPDESRVKRWPQIRNGNHSQRLIKLLLLGANLNPESAIHVDLVNLWLRKAWEALTTPGGVLRADDNRFSLRKENMAFSLANTAHVCPVTQKMLDTAFKGFTPYLPGHLNFGLLTQDRINSFQCEQVELPEVYKFDRTQEDYEPGLAKIRRLVSEDDQVNKLRALNLWTDINDRAVEGGFYYRTEEHSAQQSADRLEQYEDDFKSGKINVLNCSTTMEMGVDIGGISAVVMNNVPPHPANYLQRAGRAGRSKESRSIAFTLCKSNPHDQSVFAEPLWPFNALIPAPSVALNSARLVQRHVNSLLLSVFWKEEIGQTDTERTSLNAQWFFGGELGESLCDQFVIWLQRSQLACDVDLANLVKATALQGVNPLQLRTHAREAIEVLQKRWLDEYRYLVEQLSKALPNSPYYTRINLEMRRHCEEYLLRELAARAFLPTYGFPTDVVTFDNFTMEDYIREARSRESAKNSGREDNVTRYKNLPSRNLAIAIREYAPGAEIVLDGRVYKSAGVSLHWHNLTADSNEAQKIGLAWRCHACGELGIEEGLAKGGQLICPNPDCHEEIRHENMMSVLQPAGFVTDSYETVTNDVNRQKFIPVQPAWVYVRGDKLPLPNPALGFMSYGVDGTVFHHSAGEFGQGYALCLTCGRASSMLADGSYPQDLNPDHSHRPPRPRREDRDQNNRPNPCTGSETIRPNISLGVASHTDVFELVLRNPTTGEYLGCSDSEAHKTIATTIVVALRFAVAGILGVTASELGYNVKPVKLKEGSVALVMQIYDSISGGAGFATTAPLHIETVMRKMISHLQCDHCESSCNECLLDTQTRHDYDRINRLLALQWLEDSDFLNHIGLPESEKLLIDANYSPGTLEDGIRRAINAGAKRLSLCLSGGMDEWDFASSRFRQSLYGYLIQDGIEVDIVLLEKVTDSEIQRDLHKLALLGARVSQSVGNANKAIAVQAASDDTVISFATRSSKVLSPGEDWLRSDQLIVSTVSEPEIECEASDTQSWVATPSSAVLALEVTDELNGNISNFGMRLFEMLAKESEAFGTALNSKKIRTIHYSDRYLQSPTSILMLESLIRPLKDRMLEEASVKVKSLFKTKDRVGSRVFHDWCYKQDFEAFAKKWLSRGCDAQVEFDVCDYARDIPHHRMLNIEFESGPSVRIRFDQGVGYWRLFFRNTRDSYLDMRDSAEDQVLTLSRVGGAIKVQNSDNWATDIVLEVVRE